jgi:hypothetical protein
MATLLDKIQQNLNQPEVQLNLGVQDNTSLAEKLLRGKSGKATTRSMGSSNIQEQVAQQDTNAQLQQLALTGQQQAVSLGQDQNAQQQKEQAARQELEQNRQQSLLQARLDSNRILQDLEQNRQELGLDKQKAQLEQLGHSLALQDKKYTDRLQQEGNRMRLDNAASFADEIARQDLGNGLDVLKSSLGMNNILAEDDRTFRRKLGQISLQDALSLAKQSSKAASTQQLYSGLGGIISGGLAAYDSSQSRNNSTIPTKTTTPVSGMGDYNTSGSSDGSMIA